MTTERIIELAKQAGDDWDHTLPSDKEFLKRFYALARNDVLEEAAQMCEEMNYHYSALKDTALLNGDIDLSVAMSGEPRACEYLATAIRSMKK